MALGTRDNQANPLSFREVPPSGTHETFATAVDRGLSAAQKSLPSRFFYDPEGSKLFEQITELPEYYLTRIEHGIFERQAMSIIECAGTNLAMIEFGSGSSQKTRMLINAALKKQRELVYVPIDISKDFLRESARELLGEYKNLRINALASEYHDAIREIPRISGPRLILFLGSNIGNFEEAEAQDFLHRLRAVMDPDDRVLVGIDLLKDREVIERAYDDAAGVTAVFNMNILRRINRELGGHFDVEMFKHSAPFVAERSRVEMRLISVRDQTVRIDRLGKLFEFKEGEWIHTENSLKWSVSAFEKLCRSAGVALAATWRDPMGWYAVTLLEPSNI